MHRKLLSKIDENLNELLYLGKSIPIQIISAKHDNYIHYNLKENSLEVAYSGTFNQEIKNIVRDAFYKRQAPILFLERVQEFANLMDLHPTKIGFRKAKTRWGSCSSTNSISLNIGLVMLPKELSDYVIVHELAHIQEKNHSKNFWKLVQNYYPNYKAAREKLKNYSNLL